MRNYLTLILILIPASFIIGQSNLDQSFPVSKSNDSLVRIGITQIENKNYKKAKSTLEKAVKKAVINPAGSYYLGICENNMFRSNHLRQKDAIKSLTDAISHDNLNPKYFWRRGLVYFGMIEYRLALVDFDRAISLNPNIPEYYFYRGNCLIALTTYDADSIGLAKCALADFDKFESLATGDTIATDLIRWNYYYKAVAYKIIGQDSLSQTAISEFKRLNQTKMFDSFEITWGVFPIGICRMDDRVFIRKKNNCN